MDQKISAVLLKWKRPKELDVIVKFLSTIPEIDEIIIQDNNEHNFISYGRYIGASKAKNETIYVQDDDCIVKNIDDLIEAYNGTTVVNCLKPSHMDLYKGRDTMFGWGAIFDRVWANVLWKYRFIYGADNVLYREADRIFSYLTKVGHKTILGDIVDFPSASGENALYRQPEHEGMKRLALERCERLVDEVNR